MIIVGCLFCLLIEAPQGFEAGPFGPGEYIFDPVCGRDCSEEIQFLISLLAFLFSASYDLNQEGVEVGFS